MFSYSFLKITLILIKFVENAISQLGIKKKVIKL